jgi:hypothetical protein
MKKIDARLYGPRALCSRLRRAFGTRVYLRDMYGLVVPDLERAIKRLQAEKLCKVENRWEGGRERVVVSFAEPCGRIRRPVPQYPGGRTKRRQYLKKTAVVWILGQELKPCSSNRSPAPDVVSYARIGGRVELIRFVGRVQGGWLVQPA